MKKTILKLSAIALLVTGIACQKKQNQNSSTTTTTTTTTTTAPSGSFIWQENGGTATTADSAYWTSGAWGTGIRAFKGGMSNYFEINWTGTNAVSPNTYTLQTGTYADFTFMKGSVTYTNSTAQSIQVTASATTAASPTNPLVTGKFNVAVSGGPISTVSGTFTSITRKY